MIDSYKMKLSQISRCSCFYFHLLLSRFHMAFWCLHPTLLGKDLSQVPDPSAQHCPHILGTFLRVSFIYQTAKKRMSQAYGRLTATPSHFLGVERSLWTSGTPVRNQADWVSSHLTKKSSFPRNRIRRHGAVHSACRLPSADVYEWALFSQNQ